MLKAAGEKVQKTFSATKRLLGLLSAWGLIFSVVTLGRLGVAFDYDDTLVFSSPAYSRAFGSGVQPFSPGFWEVVNQAYDVEKPKLVPVALAWAFRILGFKVTILSARPGYGGEGLKKEWRRLASDFVFAGNAQMKHRYLKEGNYVLYFGDGDSDMAEGRKARVLTVRVRRSPKSAYKDDYNPGSQKELVLPFSEY